MFQCIGFVLSHSLKYMEREWKSFVDEYTSYEILLSNCIAAAAFLTYCGAMGVDRRLVSYRRKNKLKDQAPLQFRNVTLQKDSLVILCFFAFLWLVFVVFLSCLANQNQVSAAVCSLIG